MRPEYYRQQHLPRQRVLRASRPGTTGLYIIRESSPYSLASMDGGLEGWGSFIKSVKKTVSKAGQAAGRVVKNVAAFQANVVTLGLAGKYTGVGKWSGTKTATKLGTVVGIGAAAIAGAIVAGPMVAGALTSAAGAVSTSAGGILSAIGTGIKGLATLAPLGGAYLKSQSGQPTELLQGYAPPTYGPGMMPGTEGSYSGGGGSYGGGGGGGYAPPPSAEPGVATDWLPILLVGGIGLAIIMQRR